MLCSVLFCKTFSAVDFPVDGPLPNHRSGRWFLSILFLRPFGSTIRYCLNQLANDVKWPHIDYFSHTDLPNLRTTFYITLLNSQCNTLAVSSCHFKIHLASQVHMQQITNCSNSYSFALEFSWCLKFWNLWNSSVLEPLLTVLAVFPLPLSSSPWRNWWEEMLSSVILCLAGREHCCAG